MAYAPSAPELPESFGQQLDQEARYTYAYPTNQLGSSGMFSAETHPDIVTSFESAGGNRSGFLDESELRHALSFSGYQGIRNRTIRFLLFIYKTPGESLLRLGNFSIFIYFKNLFWKKLVLNQEPSIYYCLIFSSTVVQVLRSILSCAIALLNGV